MRTRIRQSTEARGQLRIRRLVLLREKLRKEIRRRGGVVEGTHHPIDPFCEDNLADALPDCPDIDAAKRVYCEASTLKRVYTDETSRFSTGDS
jgi:hypothetical protein